MNVSKSVLAMVAVGVMSLPMVAGASIKSNQVDSTNVVITYQMEDLKTPEGRATLERKIRSAASMVCGNTDYSKTRSLSTVAEAKSCYHGAVTDALTDLGSGMLQVSAR